MAYAMGVVYIVLQTHSCLKNLFMLMFVVLKKIEFGWTKNVFYATDDDVSSH